MGPDSHPRILLVAGSIGNTKNLSSYLAALSLKPEIISASEGRSALALLEEQAFNLVIIDASLKGQMDGYDLCRAIRSAAGLQQLPVILLLAGSLILERSKGIAAGADLLVHRPILKEELCKMVQLLVEWRAHETFGLGPNPADRSHVRRLHPVKLTTHQA